MMKFVLKVRLTTLFAVVLIAVIPHLEGCETTLKGGFEASA